MTTLIVISLAVAISIAWSENQNKLRAHRMLENLILSVTPSDLARKTIISEISKHAATIGKPSTKITGFTGGQTKVNFFGPANEQKGSLVFDDEGMARFSILVDNELKKSVKSLFENRTFSNDAARSEIIEALSMCARPSLWEKGIKR